MAEDYGTTKTNLERAGTSIDWNDFLLLSQTVEMVVVIAYNYPVSATRLRKVAMAQPKRTKNSVTDSDKNIRRSAARSSGAKESEFVRVGKKVAHGHADTLRRLAKN